MTISLVKNLMDGTGAWPERMIKAKSFWNAFFKEHRNDSDADLAKALGPAQMKFEHDVFDMNRIDAKEVMALTAFASIYDEASGFDDPYFAGRLADAFEASSVSIEVKGWAIEAAAIFSIGDYSENVRKRINQRYD